MLNIFEVGRGNLVPHRKKFVYGPPRSGVHAEWTHWAIVKSVCPHIRLFGTRVSIYHTIGSLPAPSSVGSNISWIPNASKICVSDHVSYKV
jgi:hypothetical protein